MSAADREVAGTTWTERDALALLALIEEGETASRADYEQALIVVRALRFEAVSKAARTRGRGGPASDARIAAWAALVGRSKMLQRAADVIGQAREMAAEAVAS